MAVGVGSRTIAEVLQVETVAPQRLRLGGGQLGPRVGIRYLCGQPAAGLEARLSVTLRSAEVWFPACPRFLFADQSVDYRPVQAEVFSGALDEEGQARTQWRLPPVERAPLGLEAVVTVDPDGRPVPGRPLRYRVFRADAHWWWEYEDRDEYRLRFRTARTTQVVAEGEIGSAVEPVRLPVPLEQEGEYLAEVSGGGHAAAVFVQASAWGEAPPAGEDAGQLVLRADREQHAPGTWPRCASPCRGRAAPW
ncbi:MAG: hypothetical protein AB1505_31520 [Candidatus Latescibacterota bacterium]